MRWSALLNMLALRLTEPTELAHRHVVGGVLGVALAAEFRHPDVDATHLDPRGNETELVAEPAARALTTTTAVHPRLGSLISASSAAACALRCHSTDRDCPTSKYEATIEPGANFCALPDCRP